MSAASITHIASRDNAFLKQLRRLSQESTAYRKQAQVWLEGDHLCRAALLRGFKPTAAVFSETFWSSHGAQWAAEPAKTIVMPDALFASISGLESPAGMGYVMALPAPAPLAPACATVILDRVQDAGNVGSILRSAAAFGFTQVIALKGTAALWSPKVLRAGMGAHFALALMEGVETQALTALEVPLVVTSSHLGRYLHEQAPPYPCALVMGHEGQGVSADLTAMAKVSVRIAQPGGEESLNVAAAAAICLHAIALAAGR